MRVMLVLAGILGSGRAYPAPARVPEDLGPAEIDVSGYPPEQQETYREIFLPVSRILDGGPARAINSGVIELDAKQEAAARRETPGLFADPRVAVVSRDGWRKAVEKIRSRPPCCGACPVLNREDGRRLWRFLVYDSVARKTGANAARWAAHRRGLLERFERVTEARLDRKQEVVP